LRNSNDVPIRQNLTRLVQDDTGSHSIVHDDQDDPWGRVAKNASTETAPENRFF
jgi:hypothetical protein